MSLITKGYLVEPEDEALAPLEGGWHEVRRGLHGLLLGYLCCFLCLAVFAGLVVFAVLQLTAPKPSISPGDVGTLLFAGVLVLGLLLLGNYAMLLRGMWRCLMGAPEREGAKWWMFVSMLCTLASPALSVASPLIAEGPKARRGAPAAGSGDKLTAALSREVNDYKGTALAPVMDARAYLRLAGNLIGLLSGVCFVLFLRAVALCFDAEARARLAELYLLFSLALLAGLLFTLFGPSLSVVTRVRMLLLVGAGQLLAFLWYLGLIVSTSVCIAEGLARRRHPLGL
jgi:hypothetical protein